MQSKNQPILLAILVCLFLVILSLVTWQSALFVLIFPLVLQIKSIGIYSGITAGGMGAILNTLMFISLQPRNTTPNDWLITTFLYGFAGIIITQYLMQSQQQDNYTTRIKTLQAQLNQSQLQLQAFKTALPDRAFVYDSKGYYVDVISQLITPQQQEYLIGKHITETPEILKHETALKLLETIQTTIQTGESQQLQYQAFTSKEQQWCWLEGRTALLENPKSTVPLVIWVARDVTQQKQLQDNLNKVQQLAQIGTWETDILTNYVTWSDQIYEIYGITHAEFEHTVESATSRIHPDDLNILHDKLLKNINPYPAEYRIIRPDKSIRTVFAVGEAIYNDEGILTRRIGLLQDITDRKQAEQDYIQLQSQSQHTLALQNLINNVTHDIMSPITIIKTSLYILSKTEDPIKQEKHLNQIETRVDMLQKLFKDLLQVSYLTSANLDTLAPKNLNIVTLLRGLCQQYGESTHRKNQTLTSNLPDKEIVMWLDEENIWQAISNILKNAVQYTPEDGHIHLSLTAQPEHVLITIEDNGIGIDTEHQKHIMDGFYRVKEHRPLDGSAGLGLYMSNLIVKLHGGEIDIDSTPNVGSKFHVTLPIKAIQEPVQGSP